MSTEPSPQSDAPQTATGGPLAGLRVVEVSMLGPAAVTTHLADLGADVIKVEPPKGDYVRRMTWPIIQGVSLMHLHINRGKRSIAIDLKHPEGVRVFRELVATAEVVVEAMRPGALARLGVGYEQLSAELPHLVFCTVSGYGATGPYQRLPSHGIAYDTWAGIVTPAYDEEGFCYIPEHVSIGINAAPLLGAFAIVSCVLEARRTGRGRYLDLAQSDAAAFFDWYRSETWMAYRRPEDEVTGNPADGGVRRAPGTAGMKEGVRYQIYESADGHILFMASERVFWERFCDAVGRRDLFERWPGAEVADHARGNRELQAELRDIFKQRTSREWIDFALEHDLPIAPVNTPKTITEDPQFQARFRIIPHTTHGADMLAFPLPDLPIPRPAPTVGEHTDEVLSELGYDPARIAALREAGAVR